MTDYKSYVVYGTTASVFKEMFSEAGTLAFNYIFLTGMIFSFLTLIVSFFANNYISKNLSVTK
jgi:hypothetical protein